MSGEVFERASSLEEGRFIAPLCKYLKAYRELFAICFCETGRHTDSRKPGETGRDRKSVV